MKFLNEKTSTILILTGIVLFIPAVFVFIWHESILDLTLMANSAKIGQFGDLIGGVVGSIWALASVILFYVALKDQRQDMLFTKDNFQEQSLTLKKQQFESTYFHSLNLLNNIIENINITYPYPDSASGRGDPLVASNRYFGRDSFEFFYEHLKKIYTGRLITYHYGSSLKGLEKQEEEFATPLEDQRKLAIESYEELFEKHQSSLGHYFRTIYNIIKFINEREREDPKYYTNLVRAQFSTYEHLLLFYNCLSKHGKNFYPLISKFSLLDNMPTRMLLNVEHKSFYEEKAYE